MLLNNSGDLYGLVLGHWRRLFDRALAGSKRAQLVNCTDENFLIFCAQALHEPIGTLPDSYSLRSWRPTPTSIIPPTFGLKMAAFWVFHYLWIFENNDYEVLLVENRGRIVHRTCIVPKYFRWLFMASGDVQISSIWTDEAHRRLGLATFVTRYIVAKRSKTGGKVWFASRIGNSAALAVCANSSFRFAGQAKRVGRLGSSLLGELMIVQQSSEAGVRELGPRPLS